MADLIKHSSLHVNKQAFVTKKGVGIETFHEIRGMTKATFIRRWKCFRPTPESVPRLAGSTSPLS